MRWIKPILLTVLVFVCVCHGRTQTLKVATAANLQSVIKVLDDDFKKRTGIAIEPIMGSSGKLVAQISNGAPYDVFLSADMEFPAKLAKDGFTVGQPVVYALGSLIICSSQNLDLKKWPRLLAGNQVNKIAIANAAIAPYGRAAEEMLTRLNLSDKVKSRLVYGESISQVNTYIATGVATVGFTTQSLVKDPANQVKLYWQLIDPKNYSPIEQAMVVLKQSSQMSSAQKFLTYMMSAPAKNILKSYGYLIPKS